MSRVTILICVGILSSVLAAGARADEQLLKEDWDYAPAMKKIAADFKGRLGVVIHIGDSITYANPYSAWARSGEGQTESDRTALKWMHAGADDDTDGWYLARFDHPDGGRSYTAAGGIRIDEMLAGGKQKMPPLAKLLETYMPQAVVLMLGTNDCSQGRAVDAYVKDMTTAIDLIQGRQSVCILSTIPPHIGKPRLAAEYNEAIRKLAKAKGLPLIDFEREVLTRRPNDWDGTLLGKGDVHPTATGGGTNANSAPTAQNLRNSGYLLRGWLSVKKIAEVKSRVFDGAPRAAVDTKPPASAPVEAPQGETVHVPVSRDTWLSDVNTERLGSNGGSKQFKIKSIQEFPLLDIDAAPLKGRTIKSATLHLHQAGAERLHRVTVGTVAAPWVEGDATGYEQQKGASTFATARHPDGPWSYPGSDLMSVILGQSGTNWRMADAFPPDADGWQKVAVDPAVIAARVAGVSEGFIVWDDTGSEWTREGDKFNFRHFPNRFFHSRESGAAIAPYFTVVLGDRDAQAPDAPTQLTADVTDLPAGEARVSWITPADHGPAGTVGFVVESNGKPLPRYLIPAASEAGGTVTMHLRDLGTKAGEVLKLKILAIDGASNRSTPSDISVTTSSTLDKPIPLKEWAYMPIAPALHIAFIDAFDKVQPITGQHIPEQPVAYSSSTAIWKAATNLDRAIHLSAARNEIVSFQILVWGDPLKKVPTLTFENGVAIPVKFYEMRNVESSIGPVPDPLVPVEAGANIAAPPADAKLKFHSLLCELQVPRDRAPGEIRGLLECTADEKFAVSLNVWNFTLPDVLSFLPEMNCYGLPENDLAYYRLAHQNRTVLNRVPYHHRGDVDAGLAPKWNGKTLDWTAWDKRWKPIFDGTAFNDLPRKNIPLECFYLPLFENWPTPMEGNYNGDYWADRAFLKSYRDAFVEVSKQMADHFAELRFDRTMFQCFLNGKNNFKSGGWSHATSPWLLDEPANFQDYWAIRYFGEAFHEGVNLAKPGAKMLFRADISRPEFQRNSLDHVLDYNVVAGGAFNEYKRIVLDRKRETGQVVLLYGSTNDPAASNMQPVGWCIDAWTQGADGVLPWQTIGSNDSWKKADALSLFYPGEAVGMKEPVPSIRLKAYLRGQQDVEYLVLLSKLEKQSRLQIGRRVRAAMQEALEGKRAGTGFTGGEDAGVINFDKLRPQDAWALRTQIGEILSAAGPAPAAQLVDFKTPRRDPLKGAPSYVTVGEIPPPPAPPFTTDPTVRTPETTGLEDTVAIQGRAFVQDARIDPNEPDANFGDVPRDNRIFRNDKVDAMLIRFEMTQNMGFSRGSKIGKATLSFFVWDPSTAGRTKVSAYAMKTPWNEQTVTWHAPSPGKTWSDGKGFAIGKDTGPALASVIVQPDAVNDTADPPIEYKIDVTAAVKEWLEGGQKNLGVAIAPEIDRATDDGDSSRFQMLASEHRTLEQTPKLTVWTLK